MEIWKPAFGFEELYEISNLGNMRRIARGKLFSGEQVKQAKQMLSEGAQLKQVAAFLGTSVTTVVSIKKGRTWAGDSEHRQLKASLNNSGYLLTNFCKEGKYTKKLVHRAVWEAFNGAIPERLEVNHKDLNKTNNCLDNLELVTHQENLVHRFSTRKRAPNRVKI